MELKTALTQIVTELEAIEAYEVDRSVEMGTVYTNYDLDVARGSFRFTTERNPFEDSLVVSRVEYNLNNVQVGATKIVEVKDDVTLTKAVNLIR